MQSVFQKHNIEHNYQAMNQGETAYSPGLEIMVKYLQKLLLLLLLQHTLQKSHLHTQIRLQLWGVFLHMDICQYPSLVLKCKDESRQHFNGVPTKITESLGN